LFAFAFELLIVLAREDTFCERLAAFEDEGLSIILDAFDAVNEVEEEVDDKDDEDENDDDEEDEDETFDGAEYINALLFVFVFEVELMK
jgi:Ran GTPase-activating protein (RanGAP) involved in mRNA processing and transport